MKILGTAVSVKVVAVSISTALIMTACGGGDGASDADTGESDAGASDDDGEAKNGSGATGAGEQYAFTVAGNLPESHGYSQQIIAWGEAVTEATDGAVEFEYFWSDSLLAYTDILPGVQTGQADFGNASPQIHPDLFSLASIHGVPGATGDLGAGIAAYVHLYEENEAFRAEWDDAGLVPILWQPAGTNLIATADELMGVDDLAGLRVRASGFTVDAVEAVGATSAQMSTGEVYEGLQRGAIDAYSSATMDGYAAFSIWEVAPFAHDVGLGWSGIFAFYMNKDQLESLPEAIQTTMLELAAESNENFVDDVQAAMDTASCDAALEADAQVRVWSDEEQQKLADAGFDDIQALFISAAEEAGRPGQEVWAAYLEFQENYDGGYGSHESSVAPCVERQQGD